MKKILLLALTILTVSCGKGDDITEVPDIGSGVAIVGPISTDGAGNLVGAYGLTGTFTADATGIHINKDYAGNTAPGPVWYLSDQSRGVGGGVRLGAANTTAGAHTISTTQALDYTFLVLWCEPFTTFIGNGQIPK